MEEAPVIRLVVFLTAKPGRRDELLAEFLKIVPTVRAEKGCVEYGPYVDTPNAGPIQDKIDPDAFVVLESWESLEDLGAHAAAPHMAEYGRKVKDLIANRVLHVLSSAG
jgi:quinol monooxygenase YgiN